MQETNNAITTRVIALIIIAFSGWIISQLVKFAIYSISYKKPMWKMLYQTGGFPSSHTALIVSFLISMTLIQIFELGYLDWSFAVAIVFGIIVIHDVKGLGYEARKHAILINYENGNIFNYIKMHFYFYCLNSLFYFWLLT